MKKFILILMVIMTGIWGACLQKLNPTDYGLFGLGGSDGVYSVKAASDNIVFATVISDLDDESGLARINVSDVTKLFAYYNNPDYENKTLDDYFYDTIKTAEIYDNVSSDIKLVKAINENTVLAKMDSYIYLLTINEGELSVNEKNLYPYYVRNYKIEDDGIYFLLTDSNENKFKIIKTEYDAANNDLIIKDVFEKALDENSDGVGNVAFTANETDFFVKTDSKIYKISKSDLTLTDITDKFSNMGGPNNIDLFIDALCNYLIIGSFDKIFILNTDTGEDSNVSVWHAYAGEIVNNILYLANMGGEINAIDISDPKNPKIIASSTTSEYGAAYMDLDVYGDRLYAAGGWAGLMVFDISNCDENVSQTDNYCNLQQPSTEETTEQNDTNCYCITDEDIQNAPSGQWVLLGSGCDINDMSIFNNVTIVWSYDPQKGWSAYSPKTEIMEIINEKYSPLNSIKAKEGFWIYK